MRDRCNSRNNVPSLAKLGRFSRDFIEFFCLFFFGFYFFRRPGSSWRSANSIGNNTADRTATVLRLRRRSPESKVDDARRLRSAIDGWEKKTKSDRGDFHWVPTRSVFRPWRIFCSSIVVAVVAVVAVVVVVSPGQCGELSPR